jgi:plastocyanin
MSGYIYHAIKKQGMRKLYMRIFILILLITGSLNASAATITIMAGPNNTNTFSPANVTANVGDTIKWVWVSGTHTTTSTTIPATAPSWNSPLSASSNSFSYKVTVPGTYNYKCVPHGGTMLGTITVSGTTSAPAYSRVPSVSLFPNPFNKNLSINFKNYELTVSKPVVEIYDIVGKQYLQVKFQDPDKNGEMDIDTEFLNPGVYFIYIIINGKKDIYKIIKKNDHTGASSSLPVTAEAV